MNHRALSFVLAAVPVLSAAAILAVPRTAHAGLESCGNIDVSANARCTVVTQGGCEAQCTPVSFDLACSAKLEADCRGKCTGELDATCNTSCDADCTAQCKVNQGSFDCSASCQGRCDGDCSAKCAAASNQAECNASCKATCSGHCDAECQGTPPSATCDAKCQASCKGSCTAKANLDCEISCQSKGYAQCQADLEGGCKAKCTQPQGALFCDGQYVDAGNNLQNCIDALNAYLNVKVTASADSSSSCDGGECTANANANAKATCALAPGERALDPAFMLGGLGLVGVGAIRRRRRAGR